MTSPPFQPRLGLALVLACGLAQGCVPATATATGTSFDAPQPISACTELRDARSLDPLARDELVGWRCGISPAVQVFLLTLDPVSWPVVQEGQGQPVSLEDPVARRGWAPNTTPLRVDPESDRLVVARTAPGGPPQAAYYSAFADRTDGGGSVPLFVVLRLRPGICLLGVVPSEEEARRLAAAGGGECLPRVGDR